jgi:hypothetical protein
MQDPSSGLTLGGKVARRASGGDEHCRQEELGGRAAGAWR